MYGLLINAICDSLAADFGDVTLAEVRRRAGVRAEPFVATRRYSESIVPRLTSAAAAVTGRSEEELMTSFGAQFISHVQRWDGRHLLPVLGRHLRDFINGLDNLHEYMRFVYPKMSPPSFFCECETRSGLTLHYRTRRPGYLHYVVGQLRSIARCYYNTDLQVEIVSEPTMTSWTDATVSQTSAEMTSPEKETPDVTSFVETVTSSINVILRLSFDNAAYDDIDSIDDFSKSSANGHCGASESMKNLRKQFFRCPFASSSSSEASQCDVAGSLENSPFTSEAASPVKCPAAASKMLLKREMTRQSLEREYDISPLTSWTSGELHMNASPIDGCKSDATPKRENNKSSLALKSKKSSNETGSASQKSDRRADSDPSMTSHALRPLASSLSLMTSASCDVEPSAILQRTHSKSISSAMTSSHSVTSLSRNHPSSELRDLSISYELFLDAFPFHMLLDEGLVIRHVGSGLGSVLPDLMGVPAPRAFILTRPSVEFTRASILKYTNNIFEMKSTTPIRQRPEEEPEGARDTAASSEGGGGVGGPTYLRLKGQLVYIGEWGSLVYLATPTMQSLEQLFRSCLYINDLSMHDCSRDLLLAGMQRAAELNQELDQEKQKSAQLEESMSELAEEMRRTDSLLYRMIPQSVADRLRNGDSSATDMQTFDEVTILYSDIVNFTPICSLISPMSVVNMLNTIYTQFDLISEKHPVYKVETIGDAYMTVSGVPNVTASHAEHICDMAFDMLTSLSSVDDPTTGAPICIRIGVHSGSVVAGVVGRKMARYCLFGGAVHHAELMEMHGQAMRIHVSATTKEYLERCTEYEYLLEENETTQDWCQWKTFWLNEKRARISVSANRSEENGVTENHLG